MRLFLVINLSFKNLSHSRLGGSSNKALIARLPHLHFNVNKCNSSFVKLLCLSVRLIPTLNIRRHHLLQLIATLCYKFPGDHSEQKRLIIQPKKTYPVSLAWLIKPRCINLINQIFFIAVIGEVRKKGYIKSLVRIPSNIQKTCI